MTQTGELPVRTLVGRVWTPAAFAGEPREVRITPMQSHVLESLCEGKSNRLITVDWGIAEDTVKHHVKALLRLTGTRDRTHLVSLVYTGALRIRVGRKRRSG